MFLRALSLGTSCTLAVTVVAGCDEQGGRLAERSAPRLAEHSAPPLALPADLTFHRMVPDPVHGGLLLLAEDRFWRVTEDGEVSEVLADPAVGRPRLALPDGTVLAEARSGALSAWTGAAWEPAWEGLEGELPDLVHALPDGRWFDCQGAHLRLLDPKRRGVRDLGAPELRCESLDVGPDGRVWALDTTGRLRSSTDLSAWTTAELPVDLDPDWLQARDGQAWLRYGQRLLQVEPSGTSQVLWPPVPSRVERLGTGRGGSVLAVGGGVLVQVTATSSSWVAYLGAVGARDGDALQVLDIGGHTWVLTPGGVFRARSGVVAALGPDGLVVSAQGQVAPRVEVLGDEVWAISPSGGMVRLDGDALVEEARFEYAKGLRAVDGALWVGDLGSVHRRDSDGTWRSWTLDPRSVPRPGRVPPRWVKALVPDGEGGMLLGTEQGLLRLDPVGGDFEALPLELERQPSIDALERVGDTLYVGHRRGLWVVELDSEVLTARDRFDPFVTHGLDLDGDVLLVSSDAGAFRLGVFGFARARLLFAAHRPCTPMGPGDCGISNAVSRGDGVVWLAFDARVVAVPIEDSAPDRCGDWRPPSDGSHQSPITDLTMALDGSLWATNNTGLHRLDPVTCTGRTWRWPRPPGS